LMTTYATQCYQSLKSDGEHSPGRDMIPPGGQSEAVERTQAYTENQDDRYSVWQAGPPAILVRVQRNRTGVSKINQNLRFPPYKHLFLHNAPCCPEYRFPWPPEQRVMGISFQKRRASRNSYAKRGSKGGRSTSAASSMELLPWRFPGGSPPASPVALRWLPDSDFSFLKRDPHDPGKPANCFWSRTETVDRF
jgi:hypothetical protein